MIEKDKDNKWILSEIRSGKHRRDTIIKSLYQDQSLRRMIQSMIFQNGGQKNDFDLVFNTALMQFIKTVVKRPDMEINATINSYILGISKYVWFKEIKKNIKNQSEPIDNHFDLSDASTPEKLVINHGQKGLIQELLEKLGKNCKEVLMYWANGYKMMEIAKMAGYKSEGMAKKKKHICLKELLLYLDHNPHIKSILR